jgi:hypothetical protein
VLLIATDCPELLPTVTLPKSNEDGFRTRVAVAGGGGDGVTAVKPTDTVGLVVELLMIVKVPENVPGA